MSTEETCRLAKARRRRGREDEINKALIPANLNQRCAGFSRCFPGNQNQVFLDRNVANVFDAMIGAEDQRGFNFPVLDAQNTDPGSMSDQKCLALPIPV